MRARLLTTAWLCLIVSGAGAGENTWTSERGRYVVSYTSELTPPRINLLHGWVLHIEDANGIPVTGAEIEASGGMPAHDHGLPTRPRVTQELGGGDYLLEGLRFHMAGDWEVTLVIAAAGNRDTVVIDVTL